MRSMKYLFASILVLGTLSSLCQVDVGVITGPSVVELPGNFDYTMINDLNYTNPWTVTGDALVVSSNRVSVLGGWRYTCTITFNSPGAYSVIFAGNTSNPYLVTANCKPVATPTATFSYGSGCGGMVITAAGTPPSGFSWYWQTSAFGEEQIYHYSSPFFATSSGTYYLRANRTTATGCWSAPQATNVVTVLPIPTASATKQSICSGQQTSVAITELNNIPGTTYSWTVLPSNINISGGALSGTDNPIAQTLTTTSNINGTATYSITPLANGCTGAVKTVVVTVRAVPTVAASSQSIFSGSVGIAVTNPNNVSGTTITWTVNSPIVGGASSNNLPVVLPANIIQTLTGSGTAIYTITPSNSGCLGAAVSPVVTVYPLPVITAPTNRLSIGAITMDGGAGYDTYQWKDANNNILGTLRYLATFTSGNYTLTVTKVGVLGSGTASFNLLPQLDGVNMNYIITNSILSPIVTEAEIAALPLESHGQSTQYFDGLGRPIQSVTTQASPVKTDLVLLNVYDAFGREARKYLPVATGISGIFKSTLMDVNGNYTVNTYSNTTDKIADDNRPFSEVQFEPSPLNRPSQEFGAGQNWKDNSKYIQHQYLVNVHGTLSTQEQVIAWKVDANGLPVRAASVAGYVETGGFYSTGQLSIKSTKDEQGNEVREYVDKQGRTVLKKVQAVGSAVLSNNAHWASTYYLYDDLGNLVMVLPPEAVNSIAPQN